MLLLPIVAPHGRIVNVSSDVHYAGGLNPADIDLSSILESAHKLHNGNPVTRSARFACYACAKLSQVVSSRELQLRLNASPQYAEKKILALSCHLGLVQLRIN